MKPRMSVARCCCDRPAPGDTITAVLQDVFGSYMPASSNYDTVRTQPVSTWTNAPWIGTEQTAPATVHSFGISIPMISGTSQGLEAMKGRTIQRAWLTGDAWGRYPFSSSPEGQVNYECAVEGFQVNPNVLGTVEQWNARTVLPITDLGNFSTVGWGATTNNSVEFDFTDAWQECVDDPAYPSSSSNDFFWVHFNCPDTLPNGFDFAQTAALTNFQVHFTYV